MAYVLPTIPALDILMQSDHPSHEDATMALELAEAILESVESLGEPRYRAISRILGRASRASAPAEVIHILGEAFASLPSYGKPLLQP
jgi:hypothetical protein